MENGPQQKELVRDHFDHWMFMAGSNPGESRYLEVRRLLEESIANDSAWFHPRLMPPADKSPEPELVFENTAIFIAGEKI